jgi:hypothetical protein
LKRALIVLALAAVGCTPDFEDESTVKDLRILGVSADPPEVLFSGGPLSQQAQLCPRIEVLTALAQEVRMNAPTSMPVVTLRPLVVDPRGAGRPVHYRAVACVSPVTEQGGGGNMMPGGVRETTGRGACPENAPLLAEGDAVPPPGSVVPAIEVQMPLTPALILPALDADPLGLIYGLALTAQVTVSAGDEKVIARKRVLVSLRLVDGQAPNQNPLVGGVVWRKPGQETGTPYDLIQIPEVKLGTKLRIQPSPGEKETYPTRVGDRYTGCVQIESATEALRFAFFASSGTFSPNSTNTEPPVFRDPGPDPHRLEATYEAPKQLLPGESDQVRIWIITRDERAGSSFIELPLRLVP